MQLLLFHESNFVDTSMCARDSRKEIFTILSNMFKHSVKALLLGVGEESVPFLAGPELVL